MPLDAIEQSGLHRRDEAAGRRHGRSGLRRSALQHRLRLRRLRGPARRGKIPRLVPAVDRRGGPRAQAPRHILAGHRRRICRRAEGHAPAGARAVLPQLGRLVLHVRRELQDEVQPLPRPSLPHGEGPGEVHLQLRGRFASHRRGSWSMATAGRTPPAACPTTPGSCGPRTCPRGSGPRKTPGIFPACAGRSRSGPGWHGCQMPEQLLGRIILACSDEGQLVLDPFAGSGTTLAVAKKLRRHFLGFELSKVYAQQIEKRLAAISPGDPLDGSAEPLVSVPDTANGRRLDDTKPATRLPKARGKRGSKPCAE